MNDRDPGQLYWCGLALWDSAHNGTQSAAALRNWMSTPHPGDLVIEVTTWGRPRKGASPMQCVGELVSVAWEEFPFADSDDSETYWEKIWTVNSDGADVRWENCRFVRVPVRREMVIAARESRAWPEPARRCSVVRRSQLVDGKCGYCSEQYENYAQAAAHRAAKRPVSDVLAMYEEER